jgi:hypothetical protein
MKLLQGEGNRDLLSNDIDDEFGSNPFDAGSSGHFAPREIRAQGAPPGNYNQHPHGSFPWWPDLGNNRIIYETLQPTTLGVDESNRASHYRGRDSSPK